MKRLITDEQELIGKTIAGVVDDNEFLLSFTGDTFACLRSDYESNTVSLKYTFLPADYSREDLIRTGVMTQEEFTELDAQKAKEAEEFAEKRRATRRRQYEELKREFEGADKA